MSKQKESFLDSQTVIALVLILLAWWAWDSYMKRKYPKHFNKNPITRVEKNKQDLDLKEEKPRLQQITKEQEVWFKGEKMEVLFSSKGLGIKKLKLKKYFDRNQKPIIFKPENETLFSSVVFGETIPFQVEKKENIFIGKFSSSYAKITKKIEVQEEDFALNVKTEIEPFENKEIESFSLSFSHKLPQEKTSGFLKMFLIYGMDILKGFLIYEGKEEKRIFEKDLLVCGKKSNDFCKQSSSETLVDVPIYNNTSVVALGGKYFGKAFVNKSELLPLSQLSKKKNRAEAVIKYDFLHSKKQNLEYTIFLGPKSLKSLEALGGGLNEWLDFGFFSWMARPILLFLVWLQNICHNWGLAIILLTFVIRLLLLPINIKSYNSMKVMQKIQPELKQLRETHKSDPKKMNQEVMSLMKKHKANPLGGCLPMFIQLPVFFALYRVLGESIELYQSPFIGWIYDLSLKDPYFVFPILGGLVLFAQQTITPMNLPKEQARLIKAMPLVFTIFMLNLPSGLSLYIFISGLFGLVQQLFFVRLSKS